MPERVPREVDLFSSYPCPQQQQPQQRIKNMDSRHGFSRLGSRRWPRQAWRGGWKTREDGSECRAAFSLGWRRMARLCSASEKSFDYGRWSKWQARREHDPTEGQDAAGTAAVVGQREELAVRTVPKRQARRDHGNDGSSTVLCFFFCEWHYLEALLRCWLTFQLGSHLCDGSEFEIPIRFYLKDIIFEWEILTISFRSWSCLT